MTQPAHVLLIGGPDDGTLIALRHLVPVLRRPRRTESTSDTQWTAPARPDTSVQIVEDEYFLVDLTLPGGFPDRLYRHSSLAGPPAVVEYLLFRTYGIGVA